MTSGGVQVNFCDQQFVVEVVVASVVEGVVVVGGGKVVVTVSGIVVVLSVYRRIFLVIVKYLTPIFEK